MQIVIVNHLPACLLTTSVHGVCLGYSGYTMCIVTNMLLKLMLMFLQCNELGTTFPIQVEVQQSNGSDAITITFKRFVLYMNWRRRTFYVLQCAQPTGNHPLTPRINSTTDGIKISLSRSSAINLNTFCSYMFGTFIGWHVMPSASILANINFTSILLRCLTFFQMNICIKHKILSTIYKDVEMP